MTTISHTRPGGLLMPVRSSEGVGEDAATMARYITGVCQHFLQSVSLRQLVESTETELDEVETEASAANWDGYGARPVNRRASQQARRFLLTLPTTTPTPDISADPDGEIEVSWNTDRDWVFSVSVGPTGRLTYAGMFGLSKAFGTEQFFDEIPESILAQLRRLYARGGGVRK